MSVFKYSSAHRTYSLSIKLERIYKELLSIGEINKIEQFGMLNGGINTRLDEIYEMAKEVEQLIKKLKKEGKNG